MTPGKAVGIALHWFTSTRSRSAPPGPGFGHESGNARTSSASYPEKQLSPARRSLSIANTHTSISYVEMERNDSFMIPSNARQVEQRHVGLRCWRRQVLLPFPVRVAIREPSAESVCVGSSIEMGHGRLRASCPTRGPFRIPVNEPRLSSAGSSSAVERKLDHQAERRSDRRPVNHVGNTIKNRDPSVPHRSRREGLERHRCSTGPGSERPSVS